MWYPIEMCRQHSAPLCAQYESLGMKTHYKVWEESFVGY